MAPRINATGDICFLMVFVFEDGVLPSMCILVFPRTVCLFLLVFSSEKCRVEACEILSSEVI